MDIQSTDPNIGKNPDASRRHFLKLASIVGGFSAVAPEAFAFDLGRLLNAGVGLAGSFMLSDEQLNGYFDQMSQKYDKENKIAEPNTVYHKRMMNLTKGMQSYDGLKLNYKVYMSKEVNAFAMANGTIRFYSGLMDIMTDDEIRYVVGHEVGHVKSGHTKERIQAAMRVGALREAVSATGPTVASLADSQLGDLFEAVISSRHSRANENEADDYAMKFLKTNRFNARASVTALEKLAKLSGDGGGASWLSTHPAPAERAQRMKSQLA
ncbi:MAG: M48 family metallopeptidase [Limnobacter sp.]|nr:M48 family metallopeptidase [Limnobacter sp.]